MLHLDFIFDVWAYILICTKINVHVKWLIVIPMKSSKIIFHLDVGLDFSLDHWKEFVKVLRYSSPMGTNVSKSCHHKHYTLISLAHMYTKIHIYLKSLIQVCHKNVLGYITHWQMICIKLFFMDVLFMSFQHKNVNGLNRVLEALQLLFSLLKICQLGSTSETSQSKSLKHVCSWLSLNLF